MADTKTGEERDRFLPESMDDLRGRTPDELRKIFEVLDAHLKSLHQGDDGELREMDDAEQSAFDFGMTMRTRILDLLEEHRKIAEVFMRRPETVQRAYQNLAHGLDDPAGDTRRLTNAEARDRALRVLDDRDAARHLTAGQKDQVERLIRHDHVTARRILVTENDDYRSAWQKRMCEPQPYLSPEEGRAVQAWHEFRAANEVTGTAGGMGVPVFLDPSIILTAQESGNPFLQMARQVTVNTNEWKGVSSAGVTWAFQTEAAQRDRQQPDARPAGHPRPHGPWVHPIFDRGRAGLSRVRVGDGHAPRRRVRRTAGGQADPGVGDG